jgi:hypothetical protein
MNIGNFLSCLNKIVFCNPARSLNSLGLIFNIFGVILIYRYGLPEDVRRQGLFFLALQKEDQNEKEKAKKYDRRARLGLILLFLGFIFQLVSDYY